MSDNSLNQASERNKLFVLFSLVFIFCLVLFYIAPYTRDDWAWGSSIGIKRMVSMFENYNGRYGGNVTEIILTNFRWFKAVVSAVVTSVIIYLMIPARGNRLFMALLASALILLEPMSLMNQTLVYTAGFSNYVIPSAFMLFFFKYFNTYIEGDIQKTQKKRHCPEAVALITLLSFGSCLFIEHITIYLVFLAFMLNLYLFWKYRKFFSITVGFFAGAIGGSAVMFSNGAYWNVIAGVDKYRSIGADETAGKYIEQIGRVLFLENWLFNILILITFFLVIHKAKNNMKKGVRIIGYGILALFTLFIALIAVMNMTDVFSEWDKQIPLFEGVPAAVIYCICILSCILYMIIFSIDIAVRRKMIFLISSVLVVNAPLLIVNPVSPRCFFPTYVLMIMLILQCLSQIKIGWKWSIPISGIMISGMVFLLVIYIPIYTADNERIETIREEVAKGSKTIVIAELPNENFIWGGTPKSGTKWERRYKRFYHIPDDVTLINEKHYEKNI